MCGYWDSNPILYLGKVALYHANPTRKLADNPLRVPGIVKDISLEQMREFESLSSLWKSEALPLRHICIYLKCGKDKSLLFKVPSLL
jgi:hypothetical protein